MKFIIKNIIVIFLLSISLLKSEEKLLDAINYWDLNFNKLEKSEINLLYNNDIMRLRNNACAKDNNYIEAFDEIKNITDITTIIELYNKLNNLNSMDVRKKEILACRAFEEYGYKKLVDDFMDNYLIYPNNLPLILPFCISHILFYKEKDKEWLFNCYKKNLRNSIISIININKLGLNNYNNLIEHYNEYIDASISAMVAMKKQLNLNKSLIIMIDDEIINYLEFYTFFSYSQHFFKKINEINNRYFFKDGIVLSKLEIEFYENKILEKLIKNTGYEIKKLN